MSCSSLAPANQQHLIANSTTLAYAAFTDWIPVAGLGRIKGVLKIRNADSTFRAYIAGQTASVRTDKPDAWSTFGVSQTDDGEICVGDDAVDMSDKAFVRFGVGFQLTSAGFGQADVTLQMSWDACGRVVGTQQLALKTSSTTDVYEPITGWLPALQASKLKCMMVATGEIGAFEWKLAYRTATTSPESPNAWSTNLQANYYDANGEYNSDELALSVTNDMWVQAAIQYQSGDGNFAAITLSVATIVSP